jgi:hypothetical protein
MAGLGEREQVGVPGGLRGLAEQLPVERDTRGLAVQLAEVGQQEQGGFGSPAEPVAELLPDRGERTGVPEVSAGGASG